MTDQLDDVRDDEDAPQEGDDVCDGAGDILEAVERPASSRGWGRGWPHCQESRMEVVSVGDGVQLRVRKEIASLVSRLCRETIEGGYHLHRGQCWGFACRAIRGTSRPSNHSWGLAVDLNSLKNPMGPRLVTDMPDWLPALWKRNGFRWGGDYHGRKDAMHFEYMGTRAQILGHGGGAEERRERVVHWRELRYGNRDSDSVRELQRALNAVVHAGLPVTGNYLDRTKAAVAAFQRSQGWAGEDADGMIYPGGRETTRRLLEQRGAQVVW